MGFSDSKILRRIDPSQWAVRKLGLNWGNTVHRLRKAIFGQTNSARKYANLNGTYGTANDYRLDTRYKSLAELTGTK